MCKAIVFLVQFLCLAISAIGDPTYVYQEPVILCAGKEVATKFEYGDSKVKFNNLTAINWTFRKTKQEVTEIFSYYNKQTGFMVRVPQGDRFKNRVTWIPNTINLKFSNLTTDDTGFYDVSITIFEAGKAESKDKNGTFQLTINDPCVMAKVNDEGGCTMLTCSTMEDNPVYSWTGQDAEGKTVSNIKVCPKEETNYSCCVNAQKTKCTSFTAQAAKDNGENDGGISTGTIIGVVVAILVLVIITTVIVLYLRNKRKGNDGYLATASK